MKTTRLECFDGTVILLHDGMIYEFENIEEYQREIGQTVKVEIEHLHGDTHA